MNHGIVIIGSGFAARQLVKNIRKQDANVPVTVIAADSMDEYNKPDLSHVISQNQRAEDLTRQTAGEFAEQFNLRLGYRYRRRRARREGERQNLAVRQAGAGHRGLCLCAAR